MNSKLIIEEKLVHLRPLIVRQRQYASRKTSQKSLNMIDLAKCFFLFWYFFFGLRIRWCADGLDFVHGLQTTSRTQS